MIRKYNWLYIYNMYIVQCTYCTYRIHIRYTYILCAVLCVVIQCMHYIYIVFSKTIRRREMPYHSFERKFYGASYRLC